MKNIYYTPATKIINIDAQEMIAVSNFDNNNASQSITNANTGSGSEELGAGGYRNSLWD